MLPNIHLEGAPLAKDEPLTSERNARMVAGSVCFRMRLTPSRLTCDQSVPLCSVRTKIRILVDWRSGASPRLKLLASRAMIRRLPDDEPDFRIPVVE